MSTFANLVKAAEGNLITYVDGATPAGHFAATTKVLSIPTVYLFKGELDDPTAPIVGRVEINPDRYTVAYKGGSLKGGTYSGTNYDFAKSFAAMV